MVRRVADSEKFSLGLLVVALLALFVFIMRPFWVPVLIGATLVMLSQPIYQKILQLRFMHEKRHLAALFMTLCVLFLVILPVSVATTLLGDQIYRLVLSLDFRDLFANLLTSQFYLKTVEPWIHQFEDQFQTKVNILDFLTQFFRERVVAVYQFSPRVVLTTAAYLFDFFIVLVSMFFLYIEGPRLFTFLVSLSPLRDSHEHELIDSFKSAMQTTIYGTVLTAFLQAIVATIAYVVCGLSSYFALGLLTFFMAFIPFIGTAGVYIPVAVWLFFQGYPGWAIFEFLYGVIIVSGVDSFVKPLLIQGKSKTHPLLIFFSLIGGLSLMGPVGLFFGPVSLASLIAAMNLYRGDYGQKIAV